MKTIIVPIDFSDESFIGLRMAKILAKKSGAEIQLVHVIERPEWKNKITLEEEYEKLHDQFKEVIRLHMTGDLKMGFSIKQGKVFREISSLADNYEDAIIVISTHGASGFEELFIGGNAYKITSHSKIPVMTVRKEKDYFNFNTIVLPLDTTFQTREKVPYTVQLAKIFQSEIHLLPILMGNLEGMDKKLNQYTEQVASYLAVQEIPYTVTHLNGNNLTNVSLEYAHSINADLISIMTEQEESISNLLLGSFAHQMINKADIPVLCFPNYQLKKTTEDIWDLGAFNPRS